MRSQKVSTLTASFYLVIN